MRMMLLVFFLFPFCYTGYCQSTSHFVKEITEKYFGIDPVGKEVGDIMVSLKESTGLNIDTIIEGTDTSLFYLRGFSSSFYPFKVPDLKIEFQLRESIIPSILDRRKSDTLFVIQILGIGDSSDQVMKAMTEETRQMHKTLRKQFAHFTLYSYLKKKDRPSLAYYYYRLSDRVSTLRVGFGGHYTNKKMHTLSVELIFHLK